MKDKDLELFTLICSFNKNKITLSAVKKLINEGANYKFADEKHSLVHVLIGDDKHDIVEYSRVFFKTWSKCKFKR